MVRIGDILGDSKVVKLEDVKVKFQVKLLQWHVNNLLYEYNNKFALPKYIEKMMQELVNIINNSKVKDDKEATELLSKARAIYKALQQANKFPASDDISNAVDSSLRYILFNYSKNKATYKVNELIELLQELKLLKETIEQYNISISERVKNAYKLMEQIKAQIVQQL